jgi:hypothetical protein
MMPEVIFLEDVPSTAGNNESGSGSRLQFSSSLGWRINSWTDKFRRDLRSYPILPSDVVVQVDSSTIAGSISE